MAKVLAIQFTDSSGASIARTAGPDLANVASPALWDARVKATLNALAEERLGSPPATLGDAVQSFVDELYERLRAAEKRIRTDDAVVATQATEDVQIPDET